MGSITGGTGQKLDDAIVVEADTIEEGRRLLDEELTKRYGSNWKPKEPKFAPLDYRGKKFELVDVMIDARRRICLFVDMTIPRERNATATTRPHRSASGTFRVNIPPRK